MFFFIEQIGPKLDYISSRDRFEGLTERETVGYSPATATVSMTAAEREELFALHGSRRAKLSRRQDTVFWPLVEPSQLFPYMYAPRGLAVDMRVGAGGEL